MSDDLISNVHHALESIKPRVAVPETEEEKQKRLRAEEDAADDYTYTKKKLKDMMDIAAPVLEAAADVAQETTEARHFEAFASLLKTMSDISNSVVQASKSKSEIDKNRANIAGRDKEVVPQANITQNNSTVFIGSSKEILQKLKAEGATIDGVATEINDESKD